MADDQLKQEEASEEIKEAAEVVESTDAVEVVAEVVEATEAVEETESNEAAETEPVTEEAEALVEEAAEPVTDEAEPEAEDTEPAVNETEPEAEEVAEPVTEESEPVADAAEPEAESVESVEAEVDANESADDASEESTETEASSEEQDSPESAEESAPEPIDLSTLGFTGEIEGTVFTFDQLDQIAREAQEAAEAAIETDEEMEQMYESSMTSVVENEIVAGTIVSLGDKDVVIDIGFKSDGIVQKNEFDEDPEIGMEVEVYLERIEDRNGQLILSKRKATELLRWQTIETAYQTEGIVEGEIINRIKGGMIVDLLGTEAFLPGSQIDIRPVRDFDAYLGKKMEFKVVKINPINGNVVVSHKALIEKDLEEQRGKILEDMEAGQVLEGTVKNITDFGVFIDLGGVDGLLHITDLSWGRVNHPSEMVELDQVLKVVILDYDKERKRISLGLKQLESHPWEEIKAKLAEGTEVEGHIVSITDYGAFVEIEKGIEGLVHISEMSWTQHVKHPTDMVTMGDKVKVKVLSVDEESRKISLGMKQLSPDPWSNLAEKFPIGFVTKGVVRNLTNFGVFAELEPGVDGLVHISDLSWTKKIRHPGEVVKKGQELDVVVLNIDEVNRRLSLGHKQIETNPWNQFANAYPEGADTPGKVARFTETGLVVELPLEVEAFVPTSQLLNISEEIEDVYTVGQELALRVIEFNVEEKKIVLSERAKEEAAQRAVVSKERKVKRTEQRNQRREIDKFAKGASGAPTIGEMSGLADLKAKMEAAEASGIPLEETASVAEETPAAPKVEEAPVVAEEVVETVAEDTAEPVAETEVAESSDEDAPELAAEETAASDETAEEVTEANSAETVSTDGTPIQEIQGIGPVYEKKMAAAEVASVEELLAKGSTPDGRAAIVEASGLKEDKVLTFVHHADLFRVAEMSPDFAELLVAGGVSSPTELAGQDAETLAGALASVNEEKHLAPESPNQEQIASWMASAGSLDKVVS